MFGSKKPYVGCTLCVAVDVRKNNGQNFAPAMVTAVKGDGKVNLYVFLDNGERTRVNNIPVVSEQDKNQKSHFPEQVAWWPEGS